MSARGHGPPSYSSRSTQAPGMMRHGSHPVSHGMDPDHGDRKPMAQTSELERLASDNQRLATTHVALRQDLVATQQHIQKLRAEIGSIQNENDIQIRILLEKTAKMELHVRGGENVRKELQRAHTEARALVAARQELIGQIEKATEEFKKVHADVEKIPEMHAELDGLKREHQKLRSSFEYEKSLNMEKVAKMELMEKDLMAMAREVERLRAEVLNAEKRAHAPVPPPVYGGPYPPPHRMHVGGYVDGYGNHHPVHMGGGGEGMIPYGGPHPGPGGNPPPWGMSYGGGHMSNPQWGGPRA